MPPLCRLLRRLALALTLAAPAVLAAQQPARRYPQTWAEVLTALSYPPTPLRLRASCGRVIAHPDTVLLTQDRPWEVNWDGRVDFGRSVGWVIASDTSDHGWADDVEWQVYPPQRPDTVAVRVADVLCDAAEPGDYPRLLVERDGKMFVWSGRFALAGETDSPWTDVLARTRGGGLSPIAWLPRNDRFCESRAACAGSRYLPMADVSAFRAGAARRAVAARNARIGGQGWSAGEQASVRARRVGIGMTKAMVREAWGAPDRVNVHTSVYGRREQWAYGLGNYVYFEDGVVTSVSTSR